MTADRAIKEPCRLATTGNVALSGLSAIDGVTPAANDRILVRAQTNPVDNGIYDAASGAWTRSSDMDGAGEAVGGTQVLVTQGNAFAGSSWKIIGNGAITIGTNSITFEAAVDSESVRYLVPSGTARSVEARLGDTVSVKDFGATGNGSTDDTAAFNAAIAALGLFGTLDIPKGTYKLTSTLDFGVNQIRLVGRGASVSVLLFAPTADDTCLAFGDGSAVAFQQSIQDLSIVSNDATYAKIALHLLDTSGFTCENVFIGSQNVTNGTWNYWFGGTGGSIGLKTNGREFSIFRNVVIAAQRPIVMGPNPNHIISSDHFHFEDLLLLGSSGVGIHSTDYPLVEIEDSPVGSTLYVANLSFTGSQAWVGGGYGLYWNDTRAAAVSINVTLENVRREQHHDDTRHEFYINRSAAYLYGLTLRNIYCGIHNTTSVAGLYARRVAGPMILDGFSYAGTSSSVYALDIDRTVFNAIGTGCFFQTGSAVNFGLALEFTAGQAAGVTAGNTITGASSGATATVTGVNVTSGSFMGNNAAGTLDLVNQTGTFVYNEAIQVSGTTRVTALGNSVPQIRKVYVGSALPSGPLPPDFHLQSLTSNNDVVQSDYWQKGRRIVLASGQLRTLCNNSYTGQLFIMSDSLYPAQFAICGNRNVSHKLADPDNRYANSSTATKICLYATGANYVLENLSGAAVVLNAYLIGTGPAGFGA